MPTADTIRERVQQGRFEDAKQKAFVSLLVTAGRLRQALSEACAPYGITHDQYNVLRILRGAHPGGHPRYEISSRLIERAPDVTRLLDRLERERYVERFRSQEDGRLSIARITDEGLGLLEEMDGAIRGVRERHLAELADEDCDVLTRLCMRVYERT